MLETFEQQYSGWLKLNVFERKWIMRDFRRVIGYSPEQIKENLIQIRNEAGLGSICDLGQAKMIFGKLKKYYERQCSLLQGWEKNQEKRENYSKEIIRWIEDIDLINNSI